MFFQIKVPWLLENGIYNESMSLQKITDKTMYKESHDATKIQLMNFQCLGFQYLAENKVHSK